MTAGRQQRKRFDVPRATLTSFLLAGFVAAMVASPVSATERIVVDWHTGLAIDGYDPVAFYTDGQAALGSPDFELSYGGAVWRFRNSGNRAAFAAHPDVYMPQFGGYDPVGVAHGVAVAGSPAIWLISGERLYLFYDRRRLETFIASPERIGATAARKWPDVQRTLSP